MTAKSGPSEGGDDGDGFMFIHSTHSGINAKPNKAVRSFVMKSARNKKSWSTRPKSSESQQPRRNPKVQQQQPPPHQQEELAEQDHQIIDLQTLASTSYSLSLNTLSLSSPTSSSSSASENSLFSRGTKRAPEPSETSCSESSSDDERLEDSHDLSKRRRVTPPDFDSSLPRRLGSFDCLAMAIGSKSERLIQFFIEVASPRLFPVDTRGASVKIAKQWAIDNVQSPAGGAFIYAAVISSLRGTGLSDEEYKWPAIREVNKALANPSTQFSDATIATVLILLALEEAALASSNLRGAERQESIKVNETHCRGLKLMVSYRGGVRGLHPNRCLQTCVLIHSIAQCISTFQPPYAVLLDASGNVEDYLTLTDRARQGDLSDLRSFYRLYMDDALLAIVWTATIFITDLNSWYKTGICAVDALHLQQHSSLLQYRLFDWYQRNQMQHPERFHVTPTPDQSICLALLIFLVYAAEDNTTTSSPRLQKAVSKLSGSFRNTPLDYWRGGPEVLLWTLTLGTLGAQGLAVSQDRDSETEFLVWHLRNAAMQTFGKLPITATQMRLQMEKTGLWIPSIFNDRAQKLWSSVGICPPQVIELDGESSEVEQSVEGEYAVGQATASRFFKKRGSQVL